VAGGLFVSALAAGAWCYAVDFRAASRLTAGTSAAGSLWRDAALFTGFAAHHSLFARTGLKRWVTAHVPARYERSLYVAVASVLFLAVCAWWQPVPGVLWSMPAPWAFVGWGVQAAGVVATALASRRLDVLALAGIRQARGEPSHITGIVQDGWYRVVRHPIYLAWLLMVWPAPVLTGTRAAFAALSSLYLIAAVPMEERTLLAEFGPAYAAYRRRVRWRMVPFIY
jgi:protein-S-isoprenylcysteine O-methyltransferase Ste14